MRWRAKRRRSPIRGKREVLVGSSTRTTLNGPIGGFCLSQPERLACVGFEIESNGQSVDRFKGMGETREMQGQGNDG